MGQTALPRRQETAGIAATVADAFRTALELAFEYEGATAPNPPVGCVLLDAHGEIIAAAAHRKAGELHAEARAIAAARAAGAEGRIHTVVVTLEPCNHTGRTPPCSEGILATSARVVWIGANDPNGTVAGGGAARLERAGLDVRHLASLKDPQAAELHGDCARLIAPFAKRCRTGLPYVVVKQALSADGSMIPPAGQKTFTSPQSLDFAHRLRRRADAILTGSGTVLADNPHFTVRRVPDFEGKRRWLSILDRRGRVPQSYLEDARARGFETRLETSLAEALGRLGTDGALTVLVEAGPEVTREVLESAFWDEHYIIRQGRDGAPDSITLRRREADLTDVTGGRS